MSKLTRRGWVGAGFALAVLGLTTITAFLTHTGTAFDLTGHVENWSAEASNALRLLGTALPLGFAFSAGMASAVNPCGFVMLPAYLGLFMGETPRTSKARAASQALKVSAAVTLGFVGLFGLVGLAVTLGVRVLAHAFPWIGLSTGVLLVCVGTWLLVGGTLPGWGAALAQRMAPTQHATTLRAFFGFGVAYALTSLSCTLPIFFTVVGTSLSVEQLPTAFSQFILYALGMGSVITAISFLLAFLGKTLSSRLQALQRALTPLGASLLTAAGAYTVFYWLTAGGLLAS